ncbi:hypothetical protein D9M68_859250 [compost metagenome]
MQLHPVEARLERISRGPCIGADDVLDFLDRERARSGMLDHLADAGLGAESLRVDKHLDPVRHQRRGRDRRAVAGLQAGMGDASDVPELGEDQATGCVDGIRDLAPSGHLLRCVYPRGPGIALPLLADLGALGNDQAGGGSLAVVLGHELRCDIARRCAGSGHGRHDDAAGGLKRAELVSGE